jgi:hypothetical protein
MPNLISKSVAEYFIVVFGSAICYVLTYSIFLGIEHLIQR